MHKHYKSLTPAITSAADALVSEFYQTVVKRMSGPWILSVSQFSRLMMRHPSLSHHFAVCLQSYMTSVDQSRPGRNSSYKVMNVAALARFQSFKRFTMELERRNDELRVFYALIHNVKDFCFHEWTVDWYDIAGQLPEVHRFFERPQDNMMLKRRRNAQGGKAPWVYGRT